MHKGIKITLGVLLALIVIGAGLGFYGYKRLFAPQVIQEVTVRQADGQNMAGGESVKMGSTVTSDGAEKIITLFETVRVTLAPQSSIRLVSIAAPHPTIEVVSGSATFHLIRGNGITGLTVQEGKNKIEVHGTLFLVGKDTATVYEGEVAYTKEGSEAVTLRTGEKVTVKNNVAAKEVLPVFDQLTRRDIMSDAVSEVQKMRQVILDANAPTVSLLEKGANVTHEEVVAGMANADLGNINVDEVLTKIPKVPPFALRVAELTKEIQRLNAALR